MCPSTFAENVKLPIQDLEDAPRPGPGEGASRRQFLGRSIVGVAVAIPFIPLGEAFAGPKAARKGQSGNSFDFAAGPAAAAAEKLPEELKGNEYFAALKNFESIRKHENSHVNFLLSALGANARPKPHFKGLKKNDLLAFGRLSQTFENTGVGAYLGAAPHIFNPMVLAGAGSIATVEARHAGYLNSVFADPLVPLDASFDSPLTADQVVAGIAPFIADLNGGPPVTYDATVRSDANDIAILNFALALEFLEAEYYNINVPNLRR